MKAARRFVALSAVAILAGCGGTAETPQEAGTPPAPEAPLTTVRYEMRTLERTLRQCPENLAPCASILLEYPEIIQAPTREAKEAVERFVNSVLLAPLEEGGPETSPDSLMQRFLDSYREFAESFPDAAAQWTLTRRIRPVWNAGGVFSLEATEESYTGGAHPNANVRLASFDVQTGRRVTLDDLLVEGFGAELRSLGERAFRDARQLSPADDLNAAGFWFDEGRFRLNENFAVTDAGLVFYFNRYEVAPYAMGPTQITLSPQDLGQLVRSDGPLAATGHSG